MRAHPNARCAAVLCSAVLRCRLTLRPQAVNYKALTAVARKYSGDSLAVLLFPVNIALVPIVELLAPVA